MNLFRTLRRQHLAFIPAGFLMLVGCTSQHELDGIWKVDDGFYTATYKISTSKNITTGEVMAYNDGTTVYENKDNRTHYIFKELEKKGDHYVSVDGVSGATQSAPSKAEFSLALVNDTTLHVTQLVMNRLVTEVWNKVDMNP